MKANYREMAKELSEIMHEQVCAEINFTYEHLKCNCNVNPLVKVYIMLYAKGSFQVFLYFSLVEYKHIMELWNIIFFSVGEFSADASLSK